MKKDYRYYVYIMSSKSGTLYAGVTYSVYVRALQHKRGEHPGFTQKYGCNRLVYSEVLRDIRSAIRREKEIKGWTRKKKIALIESMNPKWKDLAEGWGEPMDAPAGQGRHLEGPQPRDSSRPKAGRSE